MGLSVHNINLYIIFLFESKCNARVYIHTMPMSQSSAYMKTIIISQNQEKWTTEISERESLRIHNTKWHIVGRNAKQILQII